MPSSSRDAGLVAAIALFGACASCAPSPHGGYLAGDVSDDVAGIETFLSVQPSEIPENEGATIRISIANQTERDVQFRFPETRQIVLLVLDDGGELQYADDHTVAVPQYLALGTFESWERTIEWDGKVEVGGQRLALFPGRYRLQVGLRRQGSLYVNRSNTVPIEILPRGNARRPASRKPD
jgi:hypothetical protein